jgi:tripartite-type tricarboxylate transporter receptor subunit TctC
MKRVSFKSSSLFAVGLILVVMLLLQGTADAQAKFPTRPVNLWVGLAPGGSADVLARALADSAEKILGQKIVVVNKAGGGGAVAASLLMREKPDGYTLLLTTDTAVTRAPHLSQLAYNPFTDLDLFMNLVQWKTVWTVKADSPFKTWSDLTAWAKKNQGQLTFGHCTASSFYFGMVKIAKDEGFTFRSVPYNCDKPTMTAVLGGHVMVGGGTAAPYRSHVLAGTIRILLADERITYAGANQATFKDMKYDFDVPLLAIVLGPKGMPDAVKQKLEKAFTEAMKSESFRKLAADQEALIKPMSGKAFADYLKKTSATYEELTKEAGLHKSQKKK